MPTRDRARALLVAALIGAVAAGRLEAQPAAAARPAAPALDVPYLPQTGVLCGGAALAMVLRHLGDRRVTVDEFTPLVDERAGGIAETALVAEVSRRGWRVARPPGSLALLAATLARGDPPILLLESGRDYYHYVVLVGMDADGVVLHDPAWGPSRHVPFAEFLAQWRPSGNWMLVVSPDPARAAAVPATQRSAWPPAPSRHSPCARGVEAALDALESRGAAAARELLEGLRRECPADSRPVSELAALHFAERQWDDAARLAAEATTIDAGDGYAWQVLASSLFVRDEPRAALKAWNVIGQPRIDLVRLDGLTRTRYAVVAEAAGLKAGDLLTAEDLRRAERRLRQLPTINGVRVDYRPVGDGYVTIDAAVVEPAPWPGAWAGWVAPGLRAAVDREVAIDLPSPTGQGELWSGGWRWWAGRPRVWLALAAPRTGGSGVWRFELSREAETFAAAPDPVREERLRGAVELTHWPSASISYAAKAAFEVWDGRRRAVSVGGNVEHRFADDHVSLGVRGDVWIPLGPGVSFSTVGLSASARTSPRRWFGALASSGVDVASARAPLALWSGAGTGVGRSRLLRAHPLVTGGIVTGVFGQRLRYLNLEAWRALPGTAGAVDVAAFADLVSVERGLPVTSGRHADVGFGLRLRLPGRETRLRLDYARGLMDGARAFSIGWALQ